MTAPTLRIRAIDLYERPVTLRLPFRFGAATVTRCPQAFVRIQADVDDHRAEGITAELMVPKWFDKSPGLTHEQNFEQLREALRIARESYLAHTQQDSLSPWQLAQQAGEAAIAQATSRGLPRLVAQFGTAQMDKAVADAALRATGQSWVDGVSAGVLGDPWSPQIDLKAAGHVTLRHTVGLADILREGTASDLPQDGLPATLEAAIRRYGLHHFKLKLSGKHEADVERLTQIAALLDEQAGDYRVTLDGNETFTDATSLGTFWNAIVSEKSLRGLLSRTLLLEQPLARSVALKESIRSLGIRVPVILDESDDHPEAFEEGLALGYHGISSKACKGIYRSLHSAARVAKEPAKLLLSGEDLTCQAGLAVQQDTLLASSLGVTHIERNGHHYVDGFGVAPEAESRAFANAFHGFYTRTGKPRLAIADGRLSLASLHAPGFASFATPHWDSLQPIS